MVHPTLFFRFPTRLGRKVRRQRMLTLLLLLLTSVLFLLPLYVIYKPPALLISYLRHRWPQVLWEVSVPPGNKVVALTIDDAPSAYTEEILDLLGQNSAKATFFVIGNQVSGREDTLARAVRDGMELGNHAMRDEASRSLPLDTLERQLTEVNEKIDAAHQTAGKARPEPRLFRPGSGFFSAEMVRRVGQLGMRVTLGSVYPHDAQIGLSWLNSMHILSMVRPGVIIICHDRRSWTVPMLRRVLPELARRGYEVVTVGELLRRGKVP